MPSILTPPFLTEPFGHDPLTYPRVSPMSRVIEPFGQQKPFQYGPRMLICSVMIPRSIWSILEAEV